MAMRPTMRWLRYVNAALYVAQRLLNSSLSRSVGPASRRHETLITPARFAFSIWRLIYALLSVAVIVDCFCPVLSVFSFIDDPLRLLFTLTCVANMAWTLAFPHDYVHVATAVLAVQWVALALLFAQIIATRREYGFNVARYVCSELGLVIYFAWSTAATLISVAVSTQEILGGFLPGAFYVALLSALTVATICIVVFAGDIAFAVVAVWALAAVALKDVPGLDDATQQVSLGVRAGATQSAAIITAFIAIAIARKTYKRFLRPKRQRHELSERALPLLHEKTLSVDYGSTV
ncbi:hypothetical protein ATCC90586_002864 [Pythium insidiosum]|nr:hypothetical protein ATCC90586_002864 [Pythium insidiosum]